jgi:hypothetical protein
MSAVLSWEMKKERGTEQRESDEAVEVLRAVWAAQGQSDPGLDDAFEPKACKRMADVGFADFAVSEDGTGEDGDSLRSAWRATLEREGKLSREAGSVRDLVFGAPDRRAE